MENRKWKMGRGRTGDYPFHIKGILRWTARAKHLSRRLAEFSSRSNQREDQSIFMMTLARALGKIVVPYKRQVNDSES